MASTSFPYKHQANLAGLLAFECVARHMNFARAAAEMAVTPTAMSKSIRKLESQLGVRLFNRTTRSVSLTEEGTRLLLTLGPALDQVRLSVAEIGESAIRPQGVLRINTSYVAFVSLIQPHQAEFSRRYSEITLDVTIDNNLSDIVALGFDIGIRLGHIVQHDMIAVPLGRPQLLAVVASAAYLASHGVPGMPADLVAHDCIRHWVGNPPRLFEWKFQREGGVYSVPTQGRLIYNDMRCAMDAAKEGLGLAYVFRQFAEPALRRGELVPVLEEHYTATSSFYLYYANREPMSPKMRVFIDFVREANLSA